MKRFTLIGQPLGHSLSPLLHKSIYRQLEIDDASYRTVELSEEQVRTFFSGFRVGGFDGINVTIPHKSSVIERLDEIDHSVKILGAVNCIHRVKNKLHGHNTDVAGFDYLLQQNNIEVEANKFIILGAGGSARAVAMSLAKGNAPEINVYNRTEENAQQVANVIATVNSDTKVNLIKYGNKIKASNNSKAIYINTTSLGMTPDKNTSPMEGNSFEKCQFAIDLVYNPLQTKFLNDAQSAGVDIVNGLQMLVAQAVYSVEIWMGGNIVAHVDMNALLKDLTKAIK